MLVHGHPTQADLVAAVVRHSATYSPYYSKQAWAAKARECSEVSMLNDIPITSKQAVRDDPSSFYTSSIPRKEGDVITKFTSGSSGEPMIVKKTQLHFKMNGLENVRLKAGWGLARHTRLVRIRSAGEKAVGEVQKEIRANGAQVWTLYGLGTHAAADLLAQTASTMIEGYPSIIHSTLQLCFERSIRLPLRLIMTYGEVVLPEFRDFARNHFDCRIVDNYGTVETGIIAAQCCYCGEYHFADRHLVAEVLKEDGTRAGAGETGKIIVTPLYNGAMPLLRYEIGDYVQLANTACWRSSTISIHRIVGRERNMFKLPNGNRITPMISASVMAELQVRQFKLIQTAIDSVELHYVPSNECMQLSRETAQNLIDRYLSPALRATPMRVSEIPRERGGKYLMHESRV
jgi:phenylacetate-coenzyme A ligase PaaK-like adenylate-forming protein